MEMKEYCTQNNGDCTTCGLVNYGLDCGNNPVQEGVKKTATKHERMMAVYNGFKGTNTVNAVLEQIPDELKDQLTGRQLGLVMSAVNSAYHNGRASTGAEVIDGELIWVNHLNMLFDLSELTGNICHRCGHQWRQDTSEKPKVCPKCKSPYWDKPRRGEGVKNG
jgi:rubrerythrin